MKNPYTLHKKFTSTALNTTFTSWAQSFDCNWFCRTRRYLTGNSACSRLRSFLLYEFQSLVTAWSRLLKYSSGASPLRRPHIPTNHSHSQRAFTRQQPPSVYSIWNECTHTPTHVNICTRHRKICNSFEKHRSKKHLCGERWRHLCGVDMSRINK